MKIMAVKRTKCINHARNTKPARPTRPEPPDPIQEAIDSGIDISALKDNLALTVAERLRRHDLALDLVEMLQKAKQAMNRPRDRQAIDQLKAIRKLKAK
jgi:hypothetical protein